MNVRKRVSSEERRELILQAVIPVFAEKGFHAATTRILAEAAGVSEALLYKHFPSKESLYSGILLRHLGEKTQGPEMQALFSEPPSTGKLIALLTLLLRDIAEDADHCLPRLMAQSLLSDGAFARTVLDTFQQNFMHYFEEALEAAHRSGDLLHGLDLSRLGIWFTHHLAVTFKLLSLPPQAILDYGQEKSRVIEEALRFSLRGIGLSESALDEHLPPLGGTPNEH